MRTPLLTRTESLTSAQSSSPFSVTEPAADHELELGGELCGDASFSAYARYE